MTIIDYFYLYPIVIIAYNAYIYNKRRKSLNDTATATNLEINRYAPPKLITAIKLAIELIAVAWVITGYLYFEEKFLFSIIIIQNILQILYEALMSPTKKQIKRVDVVCEIISTIIYISIILHHFTRF